MAENIKKNKEHVFGFEKLDVWKLSKNMAIEIYNLTKRFPSEERFGITAQLNRAVISITSNIAEGSSRVSNKDRAHFYQIAYSSAMEVVSLLILGKDLKFLSDDDYNILRIKILEITNKLNALYKSQKCR